MRAGRSRPYPAIAVLGGPARAGPAGKAEALTVGGEAPSPSCGSEGTCILSWPCVLKVPPSQSLHTEKNDPFSPRAFRHNPFTASSGTCPRMTAPAPSRPAEVGSPAPGPAAWLGAGGDRGCEARPPTAGSHTHSCVSAGRPGHCVGHLHFVKSIRLQISVN